MDVKARHIKKRRHAGAPHRRIAQQDGQEGRRMSKYLAMTQTQLTRELERLRDCYEGFKQRGLALNMARGKPSPEQLELSMPLLSIFSPASSSASSQTLSQTVPQTFSPASSLSPSPSDELLAGHPNDLRNYGTLLGLPEARALMADIMQVSAANVVVGGNSSLSLMYDLISQSVTHGVLGSQPWLSLSEPARFLCPAPGYDRHFAITEHFGIEMITVPMCADGPDMDLVERLANSDPRIKGIWCVPRFSNPTGVVYSEEVVNRMAALRPAAADFRVYWDNAYAVHSFEQTTVEGGVNTPALASIQTIAEQHGNPDIWYQFCSTSKITFAGAGIAAFATSEKNLKSIITRLGLQSIGPDKINQKRHVLFLPDICAVREHMARHAAILRPKFDAVLEELDRGLGPMGIGEWTRPQGGYFISFNGPVGTARRTVELAQGAGVVLTPAGATYPYGKDPQDANIRIAPTYPSLAELRQASQIFVVCICIAAAETLLSH
jgi:DNA-binding transcriptional MocR family regulator